jgi:DNA polymerase-3 subunit gamma/tau
MLAIYRKYRPKTLSDVLGQEAVSEILKNAARLDRLSHAYLFYGPKGSGKTTTARIIAKIANCEKRQQDKEFKKLGEPCNECRPCLEIDKGHALDVIEIDAASNRGIDEIRNLKESIRVSPASYVYKVYIIDEAHQLTRDAFNALLKTLEEPPAHAILILVTTEIEKMPATIVSRAQRFHFKKLALTLIAEKLKSIVKAENINISEPAIELIAAAASGSFRDAESLLDQIASLKQGEPRNSTKLSLRGERSKSAGIDVIDVEKTLGQVAFSRTSELAELLIKNDLSSSLDFLSKINESGYNLVQFNKDLIHYFRRVLALRFSPELENHFSRELTDQELAVIKKHSRMIDSPAGEEKTIKLIKSLIEAYTEMRYSPFAIVPLEVAIIENLK